MILVFVALAMVVGIGAGFLRWRLGPAWGARTSPSGSGFDRPFGSPLRPPPRPDEGLSWVDGEEAADGWERALKGVALVLAIGAAGGALAAGLYLAGKFLFHQVVSYFAFVGTGL
jgi:hypothetical protein